MERPLAIQTVVTCVFYHKALSAKNDHEVNNMAIISKAIKIFTVFFVHGLTILVYLSRIVTSLEMSHQGR